MNFKETVKQDDLLFKGQILNLHKEEVELPNGKKAQREIVRHHGAVAILALLDRDHAFFVRQWRAPLAHDTCEVPAGKIDPGEHDTLKTAQREFNEEIGYQAQNWRLLSEFYSSPGFSDEKMSLFLATDLQPLAHKRPLDPDEFLEVKVFSFQEAQAQILKSTHLDGKTLIAIQFWQQLRESAHE